MASPINSGTMMSNPCPSTFLDKNRIIAAELNDVTGNKTLNSKYYVRFSQC